MSYKFAEEPLMLEITEEQAQFLEEFVTNMWGATWSSDGNFEINYKKKFVPTEEHEEIIEELRSEFEGYLFHLEEEDISLPRSSSYTTRNVVQKHGKFYIQLEIEYDRV